MEGGAPTSAPATLSLALYYVGANSRLEMAGVFQGSASLPNVVDARDESLPTLQEIITENHYVGFYFTILEESEILEVGYLCPVLEMEEEEGKGRVEEKKEEEGEGRVEEKKEEEKEDDDDEEEGSLGAMAKEEEEEGDGSAEEKEDDDDDDDDDEDEEEEEEEEDEDEDEEDEEEEEKLSLEIRISLDSSHASIVLFGYGWWRSTKIYSIKWIRRDEQQVTSCWLKGCLPKLDFEGPLLYSNDIEEIIKKELSPTIDCFTVNKRLGKGATSKVYQCFLKNPSVIEHAVKIVKATRSYDINAYTGNEPREIQIMSCFHDSNVVTFYQAWSNSESFIEKKGGCLDEEGNCSKEEGESFESDDSHFDVYIHIHMEIFWRTLKETLVVGKYKIDDIEEGWSIFENIAEAVSSVHQKGVIHRDLKPDNIFIGHNGKIKLGDFGGSCFVDDYMDGKDATPNRGTTLYMAPELDDGKVSEKVDIYSLGIIFLEIFHPFSTRQERYEVLNGIKKNTYPTNWVGDTNFLKKLTARSPIERASLKNIWDYIERRA